MTNTQAMKGEEDPTRSNSKIDLISAASNGDEQGVKKLLWTADPNVKDQVSQRTALHYTIWRGHRSVFSELIENVSLNVLDRLG